jgi:predicted esterase
MVRVLSSLVLLALISVSAEGQSSERPDVLSDDGGTVIQEGLTLPGWDYYARGWTADPVELQMIGGSWTPPEEGLREDSSRVWTRVVVDSAGWMADRDLRGGGYLYAAVFSETEEIVVLEAMGHAGVYVNGEPRTGNVYGFKDEWQPWEPPFDYSFVPVQLRAGSNDFLFMGARAPRVKARIRRPDTPVVVNIRDATLPDLIVGEPADYWASVALINATSAKAKGLVFEATTGSASPVTTRVPDMPPLSVRKVGFRIVGSAPAGQDRVSLRLSVNDPQGSVIDTQVLSLEVRRPEENQRRTFLSAIDGSVQYYGLNPARPGEGDDAPALVLSVHGAAVEAINQSGSYRAKTWANIVSPTNRRPFGFNWEDWGRLDALEVLDLAQRTLRVDPSRIYLTGHSMGGHGTWHLGALYPDRFAAIGPSAGWISFWSYRPRGAVQAESPIRRMMMRATLPSRTMDLAPNYASLGVYVIHGADDDNVPAEQSRMMIERLSEFHRDYVYHEEPDAGHWWDKSDDDGADCVDWPPLFDFFVRHARPADRPVRRVEFLSPNPGVTSCSHWACIQTQHRPLEMSSVSLQFEPGKARFVGETGNVERLSLKVPEPVAADSVDVMIDGEQLRVAQADGTLWLRRSETGWEASGPIDPEHKGPHRNGTFKDAFRNRVVLVYGTGGSRQERDWALYKARYDSEQFWYQGNGGIDVIPDTDFSLEDYSDRNVVLYGNADTNRSWGLLLGGSPVQVNSDRLKVGDRVWTGEGLGCLVVRPRADSDVASVAAVSGTGIEGMRLTNMRPYLSAGFAYPDLVVMRADSAADDIVVGAGFFGNDWSFENGEFAWSAD